MGLSFAGEARRRAGARPFAKCREGLFYKPRARPLDGVHTGRYLLCNFVIRQPFIGFQQNTRPRHLSCSSFAGADDPHERVPLFRC
jgi:hypothetical protein